MSYRPKIKIDSAGNTKNLDLDAKTLDGASWEDIVITNKDYNYNQQAELAFDAGNKEFIFYSPVAKDLTVANKDADISEESRIAFNIDANQLVFYNKSFKTGIREYDNIFLLLYVDASDWIIPTDVLPVGTYLVLPREDMAFTYEEVGSDDAFYGCFGILHVTKQYATLNRNRGADPDIINIRCRDIAYAKIYRIYS